MLEFGMLWGEAQLQEGGLGLHPGMRAIARLVPPYPQPAVTTFDNFWPFSPTLAPFGPIWPLLGTFGWWWALQQVGMWGGVVDWGGGRHCLCGAGAIQGWFLPPLSNPPPVTTQVPHQVP